MAPSGWVTCGKGPLTAGYAGQAGLRTRRAPDTRTGGAEGQGAGTLNRDVSAAQGRVRDEDGAASVGTGAPGAGVVAPGAGAPGTGAGAWGTGAEAPRRRRGGRRLLLSALAVVCAALAFSAPRPGRSVTVAGVGSMHILGAVRPDPEAAAKTEPQDGKKTKTDAKKDTRKSADEGAGHGSGHGAKLDTTGAAKQGAAASTKGGAAKDTTADGSPAQG